MTDGEVLPKCFYYDHDLWKIIISPGDSLDAFTNINTVSVFA